MPFLDTKHLLIPALFALCTAASAGDKPPRYVREPVLGLRLDAGVKLDPFPKDVQAMCQQLADDAFWTNTLWIFARAADAGATFYVVSGPAKRQHPQPGEPLYEPDLRGGLISIIGNKCGGDEARESFDARDFNQTPLPILQQLSRDMAERLVRAVGGADKLRAEIKHQRIDFDALSPELQEAFRPYFPAAK